MYRVCKSCKTFSYQVAGHQVNSQPYRQFRSYNTANFMMISSIGASIGSEHTFPEAIQRPRLPKRSLTLISIAVSPCLCQQHLCHCQIQLPSESLKVAVELRCYQVGKSSLLPTIDSKSHPPAAPSAMYAFSLLEADRPLHHPTDLRVLLHGHLKSRQSSRCSH